MEHDWVRALSPSETAQPLTSLATRRRALRAIGEGATAWGVAAGHRMAAYILDTLTDWPGDRSDEEREALERATEASTLDTLTALVTQDVTLLQTSSEPSQNVAFYVAEGIPLEEVVRNVHSGQEFLIQELIERIGALVPAEHRLATIQSATRLVIQSWSAFISEITRLYEDEARRRRESTEGARTQAVRRILGGTRRAPDDADQDLGHRLEQTHVGLILWLEGLDIETARLFDFAGVAASLAAQAHAGPEPLVIRRGATRVDVWLGSPRADVVAVADTKVPLPPPLRAAVGRPGVGVDGFRATHEQAVAARRVARLGASGSQVVDYADVELVSLLAADPQRARGFAHSVLGPLHRAEPRMDELRRTLAVHIDSDRSIAQTAQLLHAHRNTISYRLSRATELLPPGHTTTELRCALLLADMFPGAG
ncbi:PucR family transcriptional regulator [Streptomyces tagetis]|uniref:Helix-turn-helix domain-containing protein n=1 Tax=Streptomyces tagetis TaxID=2820809 RepID=A0A941B5E9_9ACTN|nr:helix-turn-helix domain-containing protein [Streptomyces sp. RG38]MBQ0825253.1 helix-turn-helix domain-containing protein [Streptomyces sp. RG38]